MDDEYKYDDVLDDDVLDVVEIDFFMEGDHVNLFEDDVVITDADLFTRILMSSMGAVVDEQQVNIETKLYDFTYDDTKNQYNLSFDEKVELKQEYTKIFHDKEVMDLSAKLGMTDECTRILLHNFHCKLSRVFQQSNNTRGFQKNITLNKKDVMKRLKENIIH